MNKESYEYKRGLLVAQRKKIMDRLDSQEDFPDPNLVEAYEANKRRIIDLDCYWKSLFLREEEVLSLLRKDTKEEKL